MKKLSIFLLAAVACVLTACSDYTDALPADATVLGKCDLAEMQSQTGIDLEKLMADIMEVAGDESDDMPDLAPLVECIDLSEPMYFFATGDMQEQPYFGILAKVDDNDKFVEELDDAILSDDDMSKSDLKKMKKEEDGVVMYNPRNEHSVVAISKNALLVLFGPESSDKKLRSKAVALLNGEEKGIKDNELFSEMKSSDAFASLYVSSAIVPDAYWKEMTSAMREQGIKLKTAQLKTLSFGFDATANDEVVDVNFWYKSSDDDYQEQIEKWTKCLKAPSKKGLEVFTSDVSAGFALAVDGDALVESLPDICSSFGLSTKDIPEFDKIKSYLKKINGNVLGGVVGRSNNAFWVAQTKNINDLLMSMFAPAYVGHEDWSKEDFDYYDRPYYDLTRNGNGYVKEYGWGSPEYFGYKDGFSYYAQDFNIADNVLGEKADIPSALKKVFEENRATMFISVNSMMENGLSKRERSQFEDAFAEVFDHVEYVTFSFK